MPASTTPSIPASTGRLSKAAAQAETDSAGADVLFTWLQTQLRAAKDAEDEPARYASPPCYLAEFSAEDDAGDSAQ
ncbi:hypothetical protein [Prosthecobacter sp.]|uniref:hypothetical protein n=1 Tax=Prosthecobacter sp. TaxID=1965333 RepID=UPI0037850AEC